MKTKIIPIISAAILAIAIGCSGRANKPQVSPARIIFDSDLGPDYDDVGALAFLHAMADSGKAEILATFASNRHELVVPCIEIINTYFGRPNLPLGEPKSRGVSLTASQHWPDSLVARYPHRIKNTSMAPDAVWLYRKILASQPDTSVTIVTVGFLTNLANLLKSQPDSLAPLTGQELVSKKVRRLVSMAGGFPAGREFNVMMDSTASEYVFNEWPTEVIFTGFEIGSHIFTGLKLVNSGIRDSPVKDVFRISLPQSKEDIYGRMSWDETAALIAVYGTSGFFSTVRGNININKDGSNSWENNPNGKQYYVTFKMSPGEIGNFIEARMMHIPVRK
ncbi:MAG TPA: nucleoside hydrolase [Bacteroidales bacterium]|nr:nucleoside hydrolase [Bacteroidales bacterium]